MAKKGKKRSRRLLAKQPRLKPWTALPIIAVIVAVGYLLVRITFAMTVTHTNFIDISSPQCSRLGSIPKFQFGIVGLNGAYMAFGLNPCLPQEIAKFRTYDLYVGAKYPSSHCPSGISAYDCGKRAGSYNNNAIRLYRLKPETIWIDVETGPRIPWSTVKNNQDYLKGMYAEMRKTTARIGYYSNETMWNNVTGGMTSFGENWYATGQTTKANALKYCSKSFGRGRTGYVQYVQNNLDYNVRC